MSPIFSQNECFVQPFYDHWLKLQTFSQKGEKWTLTDICQWLQYLATKECFVQPFYDHWPKLQTFSQKGEQWTSVDLCEWVQYLAKTYALCSHLTACGPNLRLFRTMLKNGLKSTYANEANIYQKRMPCVTILRHVAQTSDFSAERRKLDWNR